jgi:hypothetical protein
MGGIVLVCAVAGAAMLAGFLRGGQLDGVASAAVRLPALLLAGFALQVLAALAGTLGWLSGAVTALQMCALAALGVFTLLNLRLPGMRLLAAGVLLNLIVLGVNGGMPVTRGALARAGHAVSVPAGVRPDAEHVLVDGSTLLRPLADVWAVRPLGQVVSVGDVAQFAGLFLLVQGLMIRSEHARRPRYEEFDYGVRPVR